MWLTGRLMPDFKTIADFRRDNGPAIRAACAQFVMLCRKLNLFTRAVVALDGSKFKAVNNRDKNFTVAKVAKRIEQVEAGIARYLGGAGSGRPAGQRCGRGPDKPAQGEDQGPAPADAVSEGDGAAGARLRPTSRSRSLIRMRAQWPPAAKAPASSATTCRWRWRPSLGLPPEKWSSLRYGFGPCGGQTDVEEKAQA